MMVKLYSDVDLLNRPLQCLVKYKYTKRLLTISSTTNKNTKYHTVNDCKQGSSTITKWNHRHFSSTYRTYQDLKYTELNDLTKYEANLDQKNAISSYLEQNPDEIEGSNSDETHFYKIDKTIDLNKNTTITDDFNSLVKGELKRINSASENKRFDPSVNRNNIVIIDWIFELLKKNYDPNSRIIMNDTIWEWSFCNIFNTNQNDFLFKFYLNLIRFNVLMTSNKFGNLIIKRLLESSELDSQLVTMEYFLYKNDLPQTEGNTCFNNISYNEPSHTNLKTQLLNIREKLIKLFNFRTNVSLINILVWRKNWKFINLHLEVLIDKINLINEVSSMTNTINKNYYKLNDLYFTFLNTLLRVLTENGDMKLMVIVFELLLQDVLKRVIRENENKQLSNQKRHLGSSIIQAADNENSINSNGQKSKSALTSLRLIQLMKKPLLALTRNLRKTNNQLKVLHYVKMVNRLPTSGNFEFKCKFVIEVLCCLRSLNDARFSVIYLINSIGSPNMSRLLNGFGLINYVFNKKIKILKQDELDSILNGKINKQKIKQNGKPTLYMDSNNNVESKIVVSILSPYLTELYLTVLQSRYHSLVNSDKESNEHTGIDKTNQSFKAELIQLFEHYCKGMENISKKRYGYKINTGVLNVFLDNCINRLHDTNLAIQLLMAYYSLPTFKKSKISRNACPFSFIIYSSYKQLRLTDILHLLNVMERQKLPLTFKICSALTIKLDSLKRTKDAKFWYDKIYHGQLKVDDYNLIQVILKNGWKFPQHFDFEKNKHKLKHQLERSEVNTKIYQKPKKLKNIVHEALDIVDYDHSYSNDAPNAKEDLDVIGNKDDSVILPELENKENVALYDKLFGILKKLDDPQ